MKKFLITSLLLVSVFFAVGFVFLSIDEDFAKGLEKRFFGVEPAENIQLEQTNENIEQNHIAEYYSDKENGVFIAKINSIESIQYKIAEEETTSLESLSDSTEFKIGINSGYFTPEFNHAGLLFTNGKEITPYTESTQLTEVVKIENGKVELVPIDLIDTENTNATYFQTGPSIIEDNIIQNIKIENSLNGNNSSRRSFIGYDSSNIYIGYTTKGFELIKLGEYFIKSGVTEEDVTLINLDGGSSVSVFSTEDNQFNFGESKNLPFFILVN